jgi:hypothetical protein
MDALDLCYTSATELGRLICTRRLSPVELTEAVLSRIERLNPRLHAFLTVTADHARELARTSEGRAMQGRLLGPVPSVYPSRLLLEGGRWAAAIERLLTLHLQRVSDEIAPHLDASPAPDPDHSTHRGRGSR